MKLPEAGTLFAGKYRVIRPLGAGGFGVVLLARHEKLERDVALKLAHPDAPLDRNATTRLLSEARLAAKIRSDHVARVLDVDEDADGAPYLVLEHLHGSDLAALLKQRGRFDWQTAVDYIVQAGDAVFEAHTLGIVHRDIKPANLFLEQGTPNRIKVLDFGIAIEVDAAASESRAGSPRYMAPELLLKKGADERTDVWGLGVTLYEIVAGRPPFDGPDLQRVLASIMNVTPGAPSTIAPDVPQELDAIVARCLEKDPERRFSSLVSLLEALSSLRPATSARVIERVRELRRMAELPPPSGPGALVSQTGATTQLSREFGAELEDPIGSSTGALGRTFERQHRRTGLWRGAVAVAAFSGVGLIVFWQAGRSESPRVLARALSAMPSARIGLAASPVVSAPPSPSASSSPVRADALPRIPAPKQSAAATAPAAPASPSRRGIDPTLLEDRE